MRHDLFRCLGLMVWATLAVAVAPLAAQTVILTDTSRAVWFPSPDNAATFGGQPIVTKYEARVFLRTAVTIPPPPAQPTEPTTAPALTLDFGKPAVVNGEQTSQLLKPLIPVNTEYVMFLRAVGPGGASPSLPSPPFGYPSTPAAASAVRFTQ